MLSHSMPDDAAAADTVLTATVMSVLFEAPDRDFVVVRVKPENDGAVVIAAGTLGAVHPGDVVRLSGSFDQHPRYGRQFKVTGAIPVAPSTEEGIRRFLASGRFTGIGEKTADRVVDALGPKTFDVLLSDSLPKIEGVTRKKLATLAAELRRERHRIESVAYLAGLGLSIRLSMRALDELGGAVVSRVRADPYCLALEVDGIGFITADRVAAGLGITGEHPLRLRAGLVHVLDVLADDGHVCVSRDHLLRRAAHLLEADESPLDHALDALGATPLIHLETSVGETPRVYRRDLYEAECEVAARLSSAAERTPILRDEADLDTPLPPHLSDEQRHAVRLLLTRPVAILTGGPGVGKTTVIRAVADAARALGRSIVLAAPTGRAARRITETSGIEAFTIHRLIGLKPEGGRGSALPTQPIEADALVIDEASMLDLKLFAHVLRQLPPAASLILVGDKDQLPSVGPGDVLNDLISSGAIPVARLERIFRQESAGLIVRNAHRALAGLPPVFPEPGALSDFYFLEREEPAAAADLIRDLVVSRLPTKLGFDPRSDIQVLCPMYRGEIGADHLNAVLQEALNGDAAGLRRGDATFRVGDRVIYTRNDYERELANGDLGRVVEVSAETRTILVSFGGRTHRFESWMDLKLAFALTVHKSQGSEYPVVVLPVFLEHRVMLRRAVIYTAMTRAKKLLVIVGQPAALARALAEARRDARGSLLRLRLSAVGDDRRVVAYDQDAFEAVEEPPA
jgi:exodeoxyribonuclease V alpha subunit